MAQFGVIVNLLLVKENTFKSRTEFLELDYPLEFKSYFSRADSESDDTDTRIIEKIIRFHGYTKT